MVRLEKQREKKMNLSIYFLSSWKKKSHWKEIFLSSSKLQFAFSKYQVFFYNFSRFSLSCSVCLLADRLTKKLSSQWKLSTKFTEYEFQMKIQHFYKSFRWFLWYGEAFGVHAPYLRLHHHYRSKNSWNNTWKCMQA